MSVAERVTPWDPAARHRYVTSDGTALHVVEEGFPDAEQTLVLVHGWTLDHTSWDQVVAALADTPVRIIRYDHRGHGGSAEAPDGTATVEQAADDLAELLANRVPGRVVLVGHSMGGMALMALAQRHPALFADRVAAVALIATSCGGMSELTLGLPNWLAKRVAKVERKVNKRIARQRRKALLTRPKLALPGLRWLLFGSRANKPDVLATAIQVGRCHPASMAGFRQSIDEHERKETLVALRNLPVVVMAGGVDRLTPLPHARAIAAELPKAELVIYPGAGHMLPYERNQDVAKRLATLVSGIH